MTHPDTATTSTTPAYDSRPATLAHSLRVGQMMAEMMHDLIDRSVRHDLSKTEPPEREAFDRQTPNLHTLTYGTPEYMASLAVLGPALEHHYAVNRHHPEHYPEGVAGMTLMDLVEMLADWRASTERMAHGDLAYSIGHNMTRFSMSAQLAQVLLNTAIYLGWAPTGAQLPIEDES